MSRNAQIALLLAVATVALIAGMALRQGTAERPKAEPGASQALLAAELPDLQGQKQRMDQWRGKVIIVNFWATWCAPCREEIPELIRAQEQLGPRGVQVVGIAIDQVDKVMRGSDSRVVVEPATNRNRKQTRPSQSRKAGPPCRMPKVSGCRCRCLVKSGSAWNWRSGCAVKRRREHWR